MLSPQTPVTQLDDVLNQVEFIRNMCVVLYVLYVLGVVCCVFVVCCVLRVI